MKKIFFALSLALTLTACSGADTAPAESEATVLPAETGEPSLSSDPLMAEGDALPPPEGALSTPVEPPPAPEVPAVPDISAEAAPESAPATSSETAAAVEAPPPAPEAAQPEALPPVVAGAGATKPDRNTYQDYREYQDRVKTRAQSESELESRALFPHEDGAYQFGLDYVYKPFASYDFDPGVQQKFADSKGAALSFNYFPVRSLSFGRLGLGAQVAAYWTEFQQTAGNVTTGTSKHSIDTYGLRAIYEFQYFLGQVIVPHAFYGYDQVRVRGITYAPANINFAGSKFASQSYGGGMHLNLNRLEPTAASRALASSGIRKFYLSYTFLQRAENTGSSHYLGLKFEY